MMKTKAFKALNLMLFLFLLIVVSGCGCQQYSESEQLSPAVEVVSESGIVIQEVRTEDIYLPRYQTGKGIKFERFEVGVKDVSLDNATVLVSAHQGKHDDITL